MSLELPSPIFVAAPELASNQTVIQHVFLVVNSLLQLDFIIAMIHTLICQICSLDSVVRTLHCTIGRLPVLIQKACFCPSTSSESARSLFKSSESKLTYQQIKQSSLTGPGPPRGLQPVCANESFSLLLNNCLKQNCMMERNETSERIGDKVQFIQNVIMVS